MHRVDSEEDRSSLLDQNRGIAIESSSTGQNCVRDSYFAIIRDWGI